MASSCWNPGNPPTGKVVFYDPDQQWTNAATGRSIEREQDEWEQ